MSGFTLLRLTTILLLKPLYCTSLCCTKLPMHRKLKIWTPDDKFKNILCGVALWNVYTCKTRTHTHAHMLAFCDGHPSSCDCLLFNRNGAIKKCIRKTCLYKNVASRLRLHYFTLWDYLVSFSINSVSNKHSEIYLTNRMVLIGGRAATLANECWRRILECKHEL